MTILSEVLTYNKQFVHQKGYERFKTDKYPEKKLMVITCMDTRLIELLPRAMNLRNGDAKFVKSAGAVVTHPFGSIMRSVLVAIYKLNVQEIFIIGHYDCGMVGMQLDNIVDDMIEKGLDQEQIDRIESERDLNRWLKGFDDPVTSVKESVDIVKTHPLLPENIIVHGLLVDPETGLLDEVVNGYDA
jgi:carbonic anhydrase